MTTLPRSGRLAGIDFGTVRIGIAITDSEQRIASPLAVLPRTTSAEEESYFKKLVERESIVGFVVGLPVHLDGNSSRLSQQAEVFGDWLMRVTNLPIILFDERFSSATAEAMISGVRLTKKKRKGMLDKLAAQVLLTAYLETSRDSTVPPRSIDD